MKTTIMLLLFWFVCMSEGCHNKIDIQGPHIYDGACIRAKLFTKTS